MRKNTLLAAALAAAGLLLPASEAGAEPTFTVSTGNSVYGSLEFLHEPDNPRMGETVAWVNQDPIVAHKVAETTGLWETDSFAPNQRVLRVMEAGTLAYYCRIHPQMKGSFAIPVDLYQQSHVLTRRVPAIPSGTRRVKSRIRWISAVWSAQAPAAGQGYDIEVSRNGGAFTSLRSGTTARSARIPLTDARTIITVRARLRSLSNPSQTYAWSPVATKVAPRYKRFSK